ncbi:putative GH16 domain-containing protein [Seiridium cardinale]
MLNRSVSGITLSLCLLFSTFLPAAARYSNCSSFTTNGTAAAQFNYYRFYDFRNISPDTWDNTKNATDPNNVTAGASTSDMSWSLDWIRKEGLLYPGPTVPNLMPIDYQPDQVAIRNATDSSDDSTNTALGFPSSRQVTTSQQSSGIQFNEDSILYLSLRLKARLTGASGACAAFFTYENDTQEADIELLTRDEEHVVGFNTQPSIDIHGNYINGSHWNMTLPNHLTREDWVTYRMDWVEDRVAWYIDAVPMGESVHSVPVEPSHLFFTMWGNGGTWTNNMTLGDSALLEIQWIEVAYNLSGASPTTDSTFGSCNLDETDVKGTWDPYIFSPPHDDNTSAGYQLGINAVLMLSILMFIL